MSIGLESRENCGNPRGEKMSGLHRRTFLESAVASVAMVVPASALVHSPEASTKLPSKLNEKERREHAISSGGFSKVRLHRVHDVMSGYVERGEVPGLVTLVSRRGEVHVDVFGVKAVRGKEPIQRDTIFRISSMTKPITAAAAMILVEECKLRLDDPVVRLLPETSRTR
jgi:CubicO group peptidase (beta-lactamase class C family)